MNTNPRDFTFSPLESLNPDDKLQYTFTLGMYFIQQAYQAKDNEPKKKEFLKKFTSLLEDPDSIPELKAEKSFQKLLQVSQGYMDLEAELTRFSTTAPHEYRQEFNEKSQAAFDACSELTERLEKQLPPPSINDELVTLSQKVVNKEVQEGQILILISEFQVSMFQDAQFFLSIHMKSTTEPIKKEVTPGKTGMRHVMNIYSPKTTPEQMKRKISSFLQDELKIEVIRVRPKKFLSAEKELVVGVFNVSYGYFRTKSQYEEWVSFKPTGETEKGEKYWIMLKVMTARGLEDDDTQTSVVTIYTLAE